MHNPKGLFAYRYSQALALLHPTDYGGGDLAGEDRRKALDQSVVLDRPLTALVVFLSVVALEDLIRGLGNRLASLNWLTADFPNIEELGVRLRPPSAARPAHARLDKPFRYFDFAEVNARYRAVLGVEPIPVAEFARLHDLAIIRHTVAHHGSVISQIDVPRFQYYSVTPGALINPPPAFVRETSNYLYQIGTGFELAVRNHVFRRVIASLAPDWSKPPPRLLVDLIEAFDYFGILLSEDDFPPEHRAGPVNDKEDAEQQRVATEIMLAHCLAQLQPK